MTTTAPAPDPATALHVAARVHSSLPPLSAYPPTVPPAPTTATLPATTAQEGWSPVRTVHAGDGSARVWLRSNQLCTAGSGFQPVAMLYVRPSASTPTTPSVASNRPKALPLAIRSR